MAGDGVAALVGFDDDGRLFVGQQVAAVAGGAAFKPHQWVVFGDAVDVAAQQGAGAVVFADELVAVVQIFCGAAVVGAGA